MPALVLAAVLITLVLFPFPGMTAEAQDPTGTVTVTANQPNVGEGDTATVTVTFDPPPTTQAEVTFNVSQHKDPLLKNTVVATTPSPLSSFLASGQNRTHTTKETVTVPANTASVTFTIATVANGDRQEVNVEWDEVVDGYQEKRTGTIHIDVNAELRVTIDAGALPAGYAVSGGPAKIFVIGDALDRRVTLRAFHNAKEEGGRPIFEVHGLHRSPDSVRRPSYCANNYRSGDPQRPFLFSLINVEITQQGDFLESAPIIKEVAIDRCGSGTFGVGTIDDSVAEDDGWVIARVLEGPGYFPHESKGNSRTRVKDNDDGVNLDISDGLQVTEASGSGNTDTYTVVLGTAPAGDVTVTATSGEPERAQVSADDGQPGVSAAVTFTPEDWNQPQTITVTGVDDNVDQGDGQVSISHQATSTDAHFSEVGVAPVSATVVDDDDAPTEVALSVAPATVAENAGATTVTVTATVNGATRFGADRTVRVSVSGDDSARFTAVSDFDLAIPAGEDSGSADFTLTPTNDSGNNGNTELTIDGTLTGVTVGAATLTITDDDMPAVSIAPGTVTITEGQTATLTLTANPAPVADITVNVNVTPVGGEFAAAGQLGKKTVTVGMDDAGTLTVATHDDSTDEPNGFIYAIVESGSGYTVVGSQNTAKITVNDNDVTPSVASFASASSGASESAGTRNIGISLDPAPQTAITLGYTVSGTATSGSDYTTLSGSVSVSAESTDVNIAVTIIDDSARESSETIVLTLNEGSGYTLGSPSAHTLTIPSSDQPPPSTPTPTPRPTRAPTPPPVPTPVVSISGGSAVTEGGSASFTLTASPAPSGSIMVNVSVADSGRFALSGQTGPRAVTMSSGTATFTVGTDNDRADEPSGSITATVQSGSGYDVGSPNSASVTVDDNDEMQPSQVTPQITIKGNGPVTEGDSVEFTVTANPAPTTDLTVYLMVKDDFNGSDFVASDQEGPQRITVNSSEKIYHVATENDDIDEPDGWVIVQVEPDPDEKYLTTSAETSSSVQVKDNDTPATPTPTPAPTATPTPTPTPAPTATPTPTPIVEDDDEDHERPTPTRVATATPTPTPTPMSSPTPTPAPTPTATLAPTATPTPMPEIAATGPAFNAVVSQPTPTPTAKLTPTPTATPAPTIPPTLVPTPAPTATPVVALTLPGGGNTPAVAGASSLPIGDVAPQARDALSRLTGFLSEWFWLVMALLLLALVLVATTGYLIWRFR
ncbi:MAG: hypothetical protein OXI54_07205 [Chloroflexota bacterium]|nr:hypothetical protein [Chloroflexota bacterium]MDE2683920.1 hypothetical protein [Chloroflexota bacterium]